jgi:hypothetical protein
VVLVLATVHISSTAVTGVVALAGIAGTFLGAYLSDKRKTKDERKCWLRDHRADVYLSLLTAYLEGRAIAADRLALEQGLGRVSAELDKALIEVEGDLTPAERQKIKDEAIARQERIDDMRGRADIEKKRLKAHVEQISGLFTPIRFYGSERIKALVPVVQGDLSDLLAATVEGGSADEEKLLKGWSDLETAMRTELEITD